MKPLEVTSELEVEGDEDELLIRVLDGYLADLEAGGFAEPSLLLSQHPNIAHRLRACLAGLQLIDEESLPPADQISAGRQFDGYSIVREAGRGGMGIVYEAVQTSTSRRVALKVLPFAASLDSRQLQRFQNEAHAASHLHHPHIVPVYDVQCAGSMHFYTMQFIEGASLATLLHQQRRRHRSAILLPCATS